MMHSERLRESLRRGAIEEYGRIPSWREVLKMPLAVLALAVFMVSCNASDSIRKRTAAFEACAQATELTQQCQLILLGRHAYEAAENIRNAEARR